MSPYAERYPVGSSARIDTTSALNAFRENWKLHHPLSDEQLAWADEVVKVVDVAFYHGGDTLYLVTGRLGRSGYWHEICLTPVGEGAV